HERDRIGVGPEPPPDLRRSEELRRTGRPYPLDRDEVLHRGLMEPPEMDRPRDARRHVQHALPSASRAEDERDEIRVGQCARSQLEQALTRPLRFLHIVHQDARLPIHGRIPPGAGTRGAMKREESRWYLS